MDKPLRDLLLDCRSALRRAVRNFEDMPLRERLDDVLIDQIIPSAAVAATEVSPSKFAPQSLSAQQVAYGWQLAARELRDSHPELHQQLGVRVRELLDVERLQDPALEILDVQARLKAATAARQAAEEELHTLRRSLADAVPLDGDQPRGSAAELAQLRLKMLLELLARGGRLPPRVAPPQVDGELTPEDLRAVAAGARDLTPAHRDWCIRKALIRSQFQLDSQDLGRRSDAELAGLVLTLIERVT